jgi:hypothetical protein
MNIFANYLVVRILSLPSVFLLDRCEFKTLIIMVIRLEWLSYGFRCTLSNRCVLARRKGPPCKGLDEYRMQQRDQRRRRAAAADSSDADDDDDWTPAKRQSGKFSLIHNCLVSILFVHLHKTILLPFCCFQFLFLIKDFWISHLFVACALNYL